MRMTCQLQKAARGGADRLRGPLDDPAKGPAGEEDHDHERDRQQQAAPIPGSDAEKRDAEKVESLIRGVHRSRSCAPPTVRTLVEAGRSGELDGLRRQRMRVGSGRSREPGRADGR
jgi:hypothetical protein